jgi:hypothetical protein
MVIASPRTGFRALQPVASEFEDEREHRRELARAIRQLQEIMRLSPVVVSSVSASYTMTDIDSLVLVDCTSGAKTVTLLTAAGRSGREITVKKIDATDNLATIDAAGSETLDGALTVGLSQKNASRTYKSDGTNWRLVAAVGNADTL